MSISTIDLLCSPAVQSVGGQTMETTTVAFLFVSVFFSGFTLGWVGNMALFYVTNRKE
jgi:hypothetical protein